MEALVEENLYPSAWMPWKQNAISTITAAPDGSVLCDDTTNVNRIFSWRLSYEKGAYLLHMMRWQLGDNMFFEALRNYLNDPLLAYNYAHTEDLKHHFEQVSSLNLDVFFNQWYSGQGYPSYQVHYANEGSNIHLQLFQTTSHPSVSFYQMPVPVKLYGGGTDTTVVVFHQYSGQEFLIPISFEVDSIQFDPELWILSANNTVEQGINIDDVTQVHAKVYPNPTNNFINIEMYDSSGWDMRMYDATGREVARQEKLPYGRTSIDVKRMDAGIYFIHITNKSGSTSVFQVAVEE
jgi:hypothetical protein